MEEQTLVALFQKLTRSTQWRLKQSIGLQFINHHSQGMVKIGDRFYLSAVELQEWPERYAQVQDGYDRTTGKGIGHLFVFDGQGRLEKDIVLGEGSIYHPGGIDFDGRNVWVPVAEYRPHSRSIVYKVDSETMQVDEAFRVDDHIGGIVRDGSTGKLIGNSWGSRIFYKWTPDGKQLLVKINPSHFIDYQDGHYAGDGKMIVSGISELPVPARSDGRTFELGGLALIDMQSLHAIHEVPVSEYSPHGHIITRNPLFMETSGRELRLYAEPDDDSGSLLIYETIGLSALA